MNNYEINTILLLIAKLMLATFIGIIIGYGREKNKKPAGIKTHALVSLGACLVMLVSKETTGDPMRLSAQVVSGMGFLCAGVILVTKNNRIYGLTTAAGIWFAACIGLTCGSDIWWITIPAMFCYSTIFKLSNFIETKLNLVSHPMIDDEG